jgi:S1-C subfamily serine protease
LSARHVIYPQKGEVISQWFGFADLDIEDPFRADKNDLALAKLKDFNPKRVQAFPIFGHSRYLQSGVTLFHAGTLLPKGTDLNKTDTDQKGYKVYPGVFSIQPTKYIDTIWNKPKDDSSGLFEGKYIRTANPIAKGHSGGALIDRNGHIYGVLSSTDYDNSQGLSIDIEVIRKAMEALSIRYDSV